MQQHDHGISVKWISQILRMMAYKLIFGIPESRSGLLKIDISKKNADFTGNKVWEYADFNKDEKAYRALLCLQFQACFVVFTVVRVPRLVFSIW